MNTDLILSLFQNQFSANFTKFQVCNFILLFIFIFLQNCKVGMNVTVNSCHHKYRKNEFWHCSLLILPIFTASLMCIICTLNIVLLHSVTELEGKDVEDLFTAVLSPSTSQPPLPQVPHPHGSLPATPGTSMPHPNAGTSLSTLSLSEVAFEAVVFENSYI